MQKRYSELLNRYEKDEGIEDPFRLNTVRYLHREPLKLSNATRNLGGALRAIDSARYKAPDLHDLIAVARQNMDQPEFSAEFQTLIPEMPEKGASIEEHGRYLSAIIAQSEAMVGKALSSLNAAEREHLIAFLPGMAEEFAVNFYLFTDLDQERWAAHAKAIQILPKVDRSAFLAAIEVLCYAVRPDYLAQLESDLKFAEQQLESTQKIEGVRGSVLWYSDKGIVIGGSADNVYVADFPVVIDLGGNDLYRNAAGSGMPGQHSGLLIDLAGDDRYQSNAIVSQGSGFMGVGLLFDKEGNDRYTGNKSFVQGSALLGAGLLVDLQGDDVYRGKRYTQGSALGQSFAALLDWHGDDRFSAGSMAQGFAGPGSFAGLISQGGDDEYAALGLDNSSYSSVGIYKALSQGTSVGFRYLASGGIAVLFDEGGSDLYEGGNFSQGGGYYFGWGMLIDLGESSDRYEGSRYAQGFSAHSALGSFWDEGGDDHYQSSMGAANGAAWDLSVAAFTDDAGDDSYLPKGGFSTGASAHNGFSVFLDKQGSDLYRTGPGQAGPNDYHGGLSLSFFIDSGGEEDTYLTTEMNDNMGKITGATGVLLDLPTPVNAVDDGALKAMLFPDQSDLTEDR
ncbi:MAG: hypothetical protein OIF55_04755 [Amphritea sp.]|nr:hypothetical protein [Amphritea sp.]